LSRPPLRWGPPVAWASLILIATSIPNFGDLVPVGPPGADKLVHGTMYAVLGWLSARAVDASSLRTSLAVVLAASLFGAVDEWHQRFVPGRSPHTTDWVADTLGALTGVFAFQAARRRRESVT
jgi:VanZ family protein